MSSERGVAKVPQYNEFFWPVIRAVKETGGSASIAEMYERVVADMRLSEEVLAVPHGTELPPKSSTGLPGLGPT